MAATQTAPPIYRQFARRVLRLPEWLSHRLWHGLVHDRSTDSQTFCFTLQRIWHAPDPQQALGRFLEVNAPRRLMDLLEHLVTTQALSRQEASAVQEAILSYTGPDGWWK